MQQQPSKFGHNHNKQRQKTKTGRTLFQKQAHFSTVQFFQIPKKK